MRGGVWDDREQSFNLFRALTPTPDELTGQRPDYRSENPGRTQPSALPGHVLKET